MSEIIEVYDPAKHLEMISAWGGPVNSELLGNGLVIPGKCCGFVDQIGRTRAALLYGLRINERQPMIVRMRSFLVLIETAVAAARAGGLTHAITSTSNDVIARVCAEKYGLLNVGEVTLVGEFPCASTPRA